MIKNKMKVEAAPAQAGSTWTASPVKGRYETLIFKTKPCSVLIAAAHGLDHAANGALIAAAPDLIEALKACESAIADVHAGMDADEVGEHWQNQNLRDAAILARAAIAQAGGAL